MKKLKLLLFLFIVLFVTGSATSQKLWSLTDCIQYAQENNLRVKQAQVDAQMVENRLKQSKYELLPDLSVSGNDRVSYGNTVIPITNELAEARIRSSNFSANANMDLFRGFGNINTIQKNNLDYLASKYDVDKIRNDITIAVTNAYLLILFNMEIAKTSAQQIEITTQQIGRIEKMVASGSLPKGNLLELQAQQADEELQNINAQNQVNLAHLNLLQLLQLEGDADLNIVEPIFDSAQLAMELKPASEVFLTSLTLMPQIKSAELKLESSEKNISISRASRSPYLSIGAGLGSGYSEGSEGDYFEQLDNNVYRNVGINLYIPIFSKYSIQQSINQAKLQRDRADYTLMIEKQQLRQNVENAYADAEASLKSYYANRKSMEALEESFKYAEKRFDAGLINSVDYNTNKNNLRRAESELAKAKYEYIFKRKILDFFQGKAITL